MKHSLRLLMKKYQMLKKETIRKLDLAEALALSLACVIILIYAFGNFGLMTRAAVFIIFAGTASVLTIVHAEKFVDTDPKLTAKQKRKQRDFCEYILTYISLVEVIIAFLGGGLFLLFLIFPVWKFAFMVSEKVKSR